MNIKKIVLYFVFGALCSDKIVMRSDVAEAVLASSKSNGKQQLENELQKQLKKIRLQSGSKLNLKNPPDPIRFCNNVSDAIRSVCISNLSEKEAKARLAHIVRFYVALDTVTKTILGKNYKLVPQKDKFDLFLCVGNWLANLLWGLLPRDCADINMRIKKPRPKGKSIQADIKYDIRNKKGEEQKYEFTIVMKKRSGEGGYVIVDMLKDNVSLSFLKRDDLGEKTRKIPAADNAGYQLIKNEFSE